MFFSWKTANAALIAVLSAAYFALPNIPSVIIACIYALPAFILLLIILRVDLKRTANILSLSRVLLGMLACVMLQFSPPSIRLTSALIVTAAALTDFADGIAARRAGPSKSGALLDEEADAFFIFLLALAAARFLDYPPWIVLIGLLRYLFLLIFLFGRKVGSYPSCFKWYSRSVCAFTAAALVTAYYPVFPVLPGRIINFCSLVLLSVSFLWEALFVFGLSAEKKNGD